MVTFLRSLLRRMFLPPYAYYVWLFFVYFTFVCFLFLGFLLDFWIPSWRRGPLQATFTSAPFCLFTLFVWFVWFSPTVFVPGLFWFDSVYLVAIAGFVADQLIM